jgi:hypothetical protein
MSNPFLIYLPEFAKFDQLLVQEFLESCPGIHGLRENPDEFARYIADFDFDGDGSRFELKADLETVVIRRTGIAGVQLCYLFQASYPKPLHVIDEAYCFDFPISDFSTAGELEKAIIAAQQKAFEEEA